MDLSGIKQARYIKLGAKGAWEKLCFEDGTLRLNYFEVPYELALQNNKDALRDFLISDGSNPREASSHARQVLDFYHCGPDTLWITLSGGYLWWCISDCAVEYIGTGQEVCPPRGAHLRRTIDGWHKTTLLGTPLNISDLSGNLTKVSAYQQTICDVQAFEYLMRKIKDEDLPEITAAKLSRVSMITNIQPLIQNLTWQDFELFIDLIFSQSGWRRISSLGSTQKTLDLELLLPTTGERAIIQVKSQTSQSQLDEYIERFSNMNADKYIYAYHTSAKKLDAKSSDIILMTCEQLAEQALSAGLIDWLIRKAG